ncbi:Non-structural maintenance of chromosomes element 4 [Carpediemonas membranifera]|uniref:Non-structural maintenance of chromosomes element 4 n=1 Tax=Carpediemonas membranifera TaxID=201153 RepID=A0A8J6BXG9_9EUKA|nr:Non-structural maintenance of chromosomes element 4 [Carpediemonas membranifera]|eukprot:KAG9393471.1 Non-structural maintenance of chromosomes element 4 [Carpediemonas membranifera]
MTQVEYSSQLDYSNMNPNEARNDLIRRTNEVRKESEELRNDVEAAANTILPYSLPQVLKNIAVAGLIASDSDRGFTADLTKLARVSWVHFPPRPVSLLGEGLATTTVAADKPDTPAAPRNTSQKRKSADAQSRVHVNTVAVDSDNRRQEEVRQAAQTNQLTSLKKDYVPWDLAVVDPLSFSQTVENIFDVSHLVRKGLARIVVSDDRELIESVFREVGHPWRFDGQPVSLVKLKCVPGRPQAQARGRCIAPRHVSAKAIQKSIERFGITHCLSGHRVYDDLLKNLTATE